MPTLAELVSVTRGVVRKVRRTLGRAGLLDDEVIADTANAQPELAGLITESVSFPKGHVVEPLLARPPSVGNCGVDGFDLHAGVAVAAFDSAGRENLSRSPLRRVFAPSRSTS